jgi:hypothetical protein
MVTEDYPGTIAVATVKARGFSGLRDEVSISRAGSMAPSRPFSATSEEALMTPNDVGARLSGFGHRWFPVTVQHSWPGWEELSMVRWLACGLASVVLTVVPGWTTVPGTGWHDDPDGDGVPSATDLCPAVYDPLQTDGDLDGVGDACSRPTPTLGGPITDLRVEHVTPFGAWVNLTSPHDDEYGWDVTVVWSTDPTELTTFAGFSAGLPPR